MKLKNKKNFSWDVHWAESIVRARRGDKEYLFAFVRVAHSYDDVDMRDAGMWVGLKEKPIYERVIDQDPDSDTYKQRIDREYATTYSDGHVEYNKVVQHHVYEYEFEANKINIDKFKKLYDTTIHGTTQLLWMVGRKQYSCPYPDDFWKSTIAQVQDHILKKRSINIDKD